MSTAVPLSTDPCVLVVDDDAVVLRALETTLSRAGHRVVATGDPLAGLQCLQERLVSVIIADQRMDPMSGLELLDHARRLQPHCSRILITGLLAMNKFADEIQCGEIYRFFAKPWSTPELINTVYNAVQRYHLLCENAALQAETQRLNEGLLAEKRALEARVAQLTTDHAALEHTLAGLHANRSGVFKFCEALLDSFDGALAVRTRRTVEVCSRLADAASLPTDLRENLIASAWFHDLGLIAVARDPDSHATHDVAPAALRDHPAVSARLALTAGLGETVAAAVRAHHESFDGAGFPDQLHGREIPEVARWLTPVAYFVSSDLNRQQAIGELERLAGVAFDPDIVPHLLRIVLCIPSLDRATSAATLIPAGRYSVLRNAHLPSGEDLAVSGHCAHA